MFSGNTIIARSKLAKFKRFIYIKIIKFVSRFYCSASLMHPHVNRAWAWMGMEIVHALPIAWKHELVLSF